MKLSTKWKYVTSCPANPWPLIPPCSKPAIPWLVGTGPKWTMHNSKFLVDTMISMYRIYYLFLYMMPHDSHYQYSRSKQIEAETKWPPFSRRHFRMHFLEWKCINIDNDFTEVCSQGSIQQYSSICSDNGLAPSRRQAIIWTNDN